jgi:hypothetical protein
LHLIFHGNVEVGNKTKNEEDGCHKGHPNPEIATWLVCHW